MKSVRHYTTKPRNGGTTFKCIFCEHSVTTLDFNSTDGNRRTRAAGVRFATPQFTPGAVAARRT